MDEYSLARAFKRIEQELIFSMIRNFEKHKAEELDEGFNWDQWQVVQLRELEKYRRKNLEKFDEDFGEINAQIAELFRMALEDGQTEEEAKILEQILKGVFLGSDNEYGEMPTSFFGINNRKLESLIQATTNDMEKAEHAILRRANDLYRRTIYDAQIYAADGGTYEQAVDMATKDFCKKGITSIVYKNGSRHNISEYAEMAIRTGNKRAYLMGEGNMHAKYGVHTVYVKKRPQACPLCLRWTGRVLIDDVYGGGTAEESKRKGIPLLSTAMDLGFLHPNCKDVYSLFIPGVDDETDPWTEEEIRDLADDYNKALKKKRYEREAEEYDMLAKTRLDPDNRRAAEAKARTWSARAAGLTDEKVLSKTKMLGSIDFTEEKIKSMLEYSEKRFKNLDHEECVTITRDGKVWHTVSEGGYLDLKGIKRLLKGSYSYHNHPEDLTNYSFGEEDVDSFIFNEEQYAKASDELYEYEMIRLPETKKAPQFEAFGRHKELQNEVLDILLRQNRSAETDRFHEVMKILSKEYGFEYRRKKIED